MLLEIGKYLSHADSRVVFESVMEYLKTINYHFSVISGVGNPEGVTAGKKGTIYLDTKGPANNTLFVKEEEDGKNGWKSIGNEGVTGTRNWVDAGGSAHSVTIENGLITDWTVT